MSALSAVQRLQLIVVGIIVVVVGVLGGRAYLRGDGIAHMMVPRGLTASFKIDGKEEPPWDTQRCTREYSIPQGTHTITVDLGHERVTSYKMTIANGFDYWVIPAHADQCFVHLDVSKSRYGGSGHAVIIARVATHQPFEVEADTYFGVEGLPRSKRWLADVFLLEDVRCDRLKKTDAELLDLLGE